MKCPLCQSEMELGGLLFGSSIWRKSMPVKSIWSYTWPWVKDKYLTVHAYRCPKCGKIELISDLEK